MFFAYGKAVAVLESNHDQIGGIVENTIVYTGVQDNALTEACC
jgi:hypothetical protein